MNGIAPLGSTPDYLPKREEEPERITPSEQADTEVKTPTEEKSDMVKQAELTTLYDFRYTGKGSFIDKVF